MPYECCAVVALEIKYKAPKAHTLLELVYVRWGPIAHMVSVLHTLIGAPSARAQTPWIQQTCAVALEPSAVTCQCCAEFGELEGA